MNTVTAFTEMEAGTGNSEHWALTMEGSVDRKCKSPAWPLSLAGDLFWRRSDG
jgi:hypothetical protein